MIDKGMFDDSDRHGYLLAFFVFVPGTFFFLVRAITEFITVGNCIGMHSGML